MSPEQARGDLAVDHRADIYAMGVILYQMLTGALPFLGDNYNTLLVNVLTAEPRPLRALNPKIPADAEALVLKELSKDPAQRSGSAIEMLEAFKALEAFAERASGMSLLGTRIRNSVASGDLGKTGGGKGSPSSASRVLSQLVKGTPRSWTGTAAKPGIKPALVVGLAAAALVVVGLVVFVVLKGTGGTSPPIAAPSIAPVQAPAPAPLSAAPVADDVVRITVEGAPPGAAIFFDDAPVPMNPFPVKRREALTKIEVRADGFEPFVTAVIPKEDTVVKVAMKASKSRSSDAHAAKPAKAPPAEAKKQDSRFKEGKRGTKIGTDFE
jgi:hypothetical protein